MSNVFVTFHRNSIASLLSRVATPKSRPGEAQLELRRNNDPHDLFSTMRRSPDPASAAETRSQLSSGETVRPLQSQFLEFPIPLPLPEGLNFIK